MRQKKKRRRLQVEVLEARQLLAADLVQEVVTEQHLDRDGQIDHHIEQFLYTADGDLIRHQVFFDYSKDGSIDLMSFEAEYRGGTLVTQREQRDDNVDSQADYRAEYTFAPNGNRVTEFEEWDWDRDGEFETYRTSRSDDEFNLLESYDVVDEQQNGTPDYAYGYEAEYQDENRFYRSYIDTDLDGEPDIITQEQRFNGEGLQVYTLDVQDEDRDGTPERFNETVYSEDRSFATTFRELVDVNFDNVPDLVSVVNEYEPSGREVLFNMQTFDYGNDGTIDLVANVFRRTPDGRTQESVHRKDFDHDGNVDSFVETTFDDNGQVLLSINLFDENDDGTFDSETRREGTYDDQGRRLTNLEVSKDANDQIATLQTNAYAGDQLVLSEFKTDYGADGTYDFVSLRRENLPDGRQVSSESRSDENQDGIAEDYNTTFWVYSEAGILQSRTEERLRDFNRDRISDVRKLVTNYTSDGELLDEVETYDFGNNGVIDQSSIVTATYASNVQLSLRIEDDYNADGTVDFVRREIEWDEEGRLLLGVDGVDRNRNGVAEETKRNSNSYAEDGSRVNTIEEFRGSVETNPTKVVTISYDAEGRLVNQVTENDDDADGIFDDTTTFITVYDAEGNVQLTSLQRDTNGDGTIDNRTDAVATFNEDNRLLTKEESTTLNGVKMINATEMGELDAETGDWVTSRTETRNGLRVVVARSRTNSAGELVSEENRSYFDSNALADSVERIDRTYREDGSVLTEVVKSSREIRNGVLATADVTATEFHPSGAVKSETQGEASSFDVGIETLRFMATYDDEGRQVEFRDYQDRNSDGMLDLHVSSTTYYGNGNVEAERSELDLGNDGTIELVESEVEYDDSGRELFRAGRADLDGDGTVDFLTWVRVTYDESGNTLTLEAQNGGDFDDSEGMDVQYSFEEYDEFGSVVSSRTEVDWGNDGKIDFVQSIIERFEDGTTRHYNAEDFDFDGQADRIEETISDAEFRTLSTTSQEDLDEDGKIDFFLKDTYFIDPAGNQLPLVTESRNDDDTDGEVDVYIRQAYTYRENGIRETYRVEFDFGDDGSVDLVGEEISYDERGNPARLIIRSDNDQDGQLDYFREETIEHNGLGQPCQIMVRDDRNNDGIVDYISTEVFYYAGPFNQIGVARTVDENADGIPETETEVEGEFLQAGDTIGVLSQLQSDLTARGLSTAAVKNVIANVELGTELSQDRAIGELYGVIDAIEGAEGITDLQRQAMLVNGEQAVLFINGNSTVGLQADLNGDGIVGFRDFLILSTNFGAEGDSVVRATGDVNGDSKVDFADFLILSQGFGKEEA